MHRYASGLPIFFTHDQMGVVVVSSQESATPVTLSDTMSRVLVPDKTTNTEATATEGSSVSTAFVDKANCFQ